MDAPALGGDEFMILLRGLDHAAAMQEYNRRVWRAAHLSPPDLGLFARERIRSRTLDIRRTPEKTKPSPALNRGGRLSATETQSMKGGYLVSLDMDHERRVVIVEHQEHRLGLVIDLLAEGVQQSVDN